jgi:hypothetical protein
MADQKIDTAIVIGAKAREIERDHQRVTPALSVPDLRVRCFDGSARP